METKKTIAGTLALLTALAVFVVGASALSIGDIRLQLPGSSFATVQYSGTPYSHTFSLNTSGLVYEPCTDPVYFQIGNCNYLHKCYVIAPEGCADPACFIDYDCTQLGDTLSNPEVVTVSYTPTVADIGQTYAVAAFMTDARLTYDWTTSTWSDHTAAVPSTEQYDYITVQGAPTPPGVDPLASIGQIFSSIISGIQGWICGTFGFWC